MTSRSRLPKADVAGREASFSVPSSWGTEAWTSDLGPLLCTRRSTHAQDAVRVGEVTLVFPTELVPCLLRLLRPQHASQGADRARLSVRGPGALGAVTPQQEPRLARPLRTCGGRRGCTRGSLSPAAEVGFEVLALVTHPTPMAPSPPIVLQSISSSQKTVQLSGASGARVLVVSPPGRAGLRGSSPCPPPAGPGVPQGPPRCAPPHDSELGGRPVAS